jgi:putative nucleotidyltransferase with HDIG domain
MEKTHRETIEALAVAINAKDEVTHDHVLRVQIYAAGVARALGCARDEIEALKAGALLHDIGKIAVPDYVFTKPGKLTAAEFEKMKIHTIAGAQILSRVEFPYPIVPVVRHHHERWDGNGYPDGLAGEDIPLTARILTVVDSFDAMREDRRYRKGMSRDDAKDLIMKGSGKQYDPRVVHTFITNLPEFEAQISALRGPTLQTFGNEPTEQLSEAARLVPPASGLAEEDDHIVSEERGSGEMKALCDLAKTVIGASGKDEIIAAFTQTLNSVIPYCTCAITFIDPVTGNSAVTHAVGRHRQDLLGRPIAPGEGVTGWVLANRKPFCNSDPKLDLPAVLIGQSPDYRTLASFPILSNSVMYGVLTVYSSALSEYTKLHQRLIEEAVALMATAIAADARRKRLSNAESSLPTLSAAGSSLGFRTMMSKRDLTH